MPHHQPPRPLPLAHPRSRGEHIETYPVDAFPQGSSPLARGTPSLPVFLGVFLRRGLGCAARLIPARAGNTIWVQLNSPAGSAHPRSRGEHITNVIFGVIVGGSSPLARGTPARFPACYRRARLIPARAGSTCRRGRTRRPSSAHPRSRGEHKTSLNSLGLSCGSSPLARGTHDSHSSD